MTLVWWNGLRLRLSLNDVLHGFAAGLGSGHRLDGRGAAVGVDFYSCTSAPKSPTNRFADDPNAAAVGVRLFHDERLSANGKISCAHCHRVEHAFTDQKRVAVGLGTGTRNTMSLLDVAHVRQPFWDGAADSLWMQALEPFEARLWNMASIGSPFCGRSLKTIRCVRRSPRCSVPSLMCQTTQGFLPPPLVRRLRLRCARLGPA